MFQIEPILFLQSFASDAMTKFMILISQMGYTPFYIAVLSVVIFGIHFRKGFVLLQIVLWNGIITDLLKNIFTLPRPTDVDFSVQFLGTDYSNSTLFQGMAGKEFFQLPDPSVIDHFRSLPEWSFGFPSGHVSGTTALWGGMHRLFRKKWIFALCIVMAVLMPLSRMYLGRHFLADVTGGLLLGGILVLVADSLAIRSSAPFRITQTVRLHLRWNGQSLLVLSGLLIAPLIFILYPSMVDPGDVGRLFGINTAFLLIGIRGFPDDGGSLLKRACRVIICPVLFLIFTLLLNKLVELASLNEDYILITFFVSALVSFIMIWGTVWLSFRIGLYEPLLSDKIRE